MVIIKAARTAFGQDGYSHTSIETIAALAGVSTRTIYNHFGSKEELFSTVLHASASHVADEFVRAVEQSLTGAELEADLLTLGQIFAAQRTDFPEHFAMIEQIRTESSRFPPSIIAAWRRAGPQRVRAEVARRLRDLADRGLLRIDDPGRAAVHFVALATAGLTIRDHDEPAPSAEDVRATVAAGVHAFLHGYAAPPAGGPV